MAQRIYIVTLTKAEQDNNNPERLVRAHSQAQAIRQVARDYQATVAGQEVLVGAMSSGVRVETAGDIDQREIFDEQPDELAPFVHNRLAELDRELQEERAGTTD
jgi:hypothetical protein